MEKNIITIIKKSIKERTLFSKIFCFFLIKLGYSNMSLQSLQVRYKTYLKVKRKYKKVLKNKSYDKTKITNFSPVKNVWICWFQDLENAPKIVQKCVNSVYTNLSDWNIHIITKKNLNEYIQFPEYILDKWEKGIISNTHMSDIIRTELLIEYGGLWLDSTVFLTDKVPEFVYNKELFLYSYKCMEDEAIQCNSWFIYSVPNNRVLKTIRDLLYEYWKKENRLKDYFLWHIFATMTFEKYKDDYTDIYYVTDESAHYLGRNLLNQYDNKYWEVLKKYSSIHKLNYKFDKNQPIKGTYLEHIYGEEKNNEE